MKTLVAGASHKPERYSNMAVRMLKDYDHEVIALGRRAQKVDDWEIITGEPDIKGVDTLTLYLNAQNQRQYYNYFKSLNPRRVIFNPGAENPELYQMMEEQGAECVQACTLVMLRTNQY